MLQRPHNLAIGSEGSEVIRFLYQIAITMQWDLDMLLQCFSFVLSELPAPPGVVWRLQFVSFLSTSRLLRRSRCFLLRNSWQVHC